MAGQKILVVEDNNVNLRALEATLQKAGYTVVSFKNGEEAIQKVRDIRPDLILLDIKLPGINGTEVGAKLKTYPETAHIPIFYITGLLDKEEEAELQHSLLGNYFIAKPFDPIKLLKAIKDRIG